MAFLRVQRDDDIPSRPRKRGFDPCGRLVSRFLVPGPRRFISRFADRVLPVDLACQPKADSFRRPPALGSK